MTFVAGALRISSGVIVWALHFAAIYGLTALACARDAAHLVAWIVAVPTALAAAALVAIVAIVRPRHAQFEAWLTAAVASIALLAVLFEAASVVFVEAPCA